MESPEYTAVLLDRNGRVVNSCILKDYGDSSPNPELVFRRFAVWNGEINYPHSPCHKEPFTRGLALVADQSEGSYSSNATDEVPF